MTAAIASSKDFLAGLEPEARAAFEPMSDVTSRLTTLVERARSAWPAFAIPPERFVACIAERLTLDDNPVEQLAQIRVEDLYLACGCAFGIRQALDAFEQRFGADLNRVIARISNRTESYEDLRQRVMQKLFVGDGSRPPKILAYGGRGSLRAWVRVTSVRAILDIVRWGSESRRKAALESAMLDALPASERDPELDYIRQAHADRLPQALRTAFSDLTPRQRNLLRQRFVHGMSTERIATMYGVHRATAFRWLESARQELFERTRAVIIAQLHVSERELHSLIGLLRSRLDISIAGLMDSECDRDA